MFATCADAMKRIKRLKDKKKGWNMNTKKKKIMSKKYDIKRTFLNREEPR